MVVGKNTENLVFWSNIKNTTSWDQMVRQDSRCHLLGESNGQHTSVWQKCCPLPSLLPIAIILAQCQLILAWLWLKSIAHCPHFSPLPSPNVYIIINDIIILYNISYLILEQKFHILEIFIKTKKKSDEQKGPFKNERTSNLFNF